MKSFSLFNTNWFFEDTCFEEKIKVHLDLSLIHRLHILFISVGQPEINEK